MKEWIKIERLEGNRLYPTSIRPYNIMAVDKTSDGTCDIYLDDERHSSYTVAEPYEDVMAKVKEAEEPVTVPFVEHFTREQYEGILDAMNRLVSPSEATQKIIDKLEEILKEYK